MVKIINKGLNELGAKEMTKLFEGNAKEFPDSNWIFKVGMRIGKTSKVQQKFNSNTTMGFYGIHSCTEGPVQIPLNWLNYELKEFKEI
jgi:hypothetical protein